MFALHKGYLSTGKFRPFHQPIFPQNSVQLRSGMSSSCPIIASVLYSGGVLRLAEGERERSGQLHARASLVRALESTQ